MNVNYNLIKQYDFKESSDIFYLLMWMEELYPNFGFRMNLQGEEKINTAFIIRNKMKNRRNEKRNNK